MEVGGVWRRLNFFLDQWGFMDIIVDIEAKLKSDENLMNTKIMVLIYT